MPPPPRRPVTPAQQKEAIRRRAPGATLQELAKSYNVSSTTISRLTARMNPPPPPRKAVKRKNPRPWLPSKLTPQIIAHYRQYILDMLIEAGFAASTNAGGGLKVISEAVRLSHHCGVQAWVSNTRARLFTLNGGKRIDIGWWPVTDAKAIEAVLRQHIEL